MSSKFATRQATGSPKSRLSKISKKNIRTHTMEIFTDQRKTNLNSPILYNKPLKRYNTLKLKVVDIMRISKNDIFFRKGYEQPLTDEVFELSGKIYKKPSTYTIKDLNKEVILGKLDSFTF